MNFKEKIDEQYHLTAADWKLTMQSFTPEKILAKALFLKQGDISNGLAYIQSGLLRSFIYDDDGNEITTHFFLPETVLISTESFNQQKPAGENIVAIENSKLLVVSYEKMQTLIQALPVWTQIAKDVAEIKNRDLMKRTIQLQTLSATERYRLFCRDYPEVMQKVALRHIASFIGIDIATLSRIRKKQTLF